MPPEPSDDATVAPPTRLTYLVRQLQEVLHARLDEITQRFGLTPKQYSALSQLTKHPHMSSAALARMTFVTPQAANEMVATLERKGFLTRSVDQGNRRRLDVVITPAATTALARCNDLVAQLETDIFRDIDPTDQHHFKRLLQQAIEAAQPTRP